MPRLVLLLSVILLSSVGQLRGQNLLLNPSFEFGAGAPTNWVFNNSFYCQWDAFGLTGRSVSLTNYNAFCNGMQWRSAAFTPESGKPHLVNVWAVSSNAAEVVRLQFGLGTPANSSLADRYVYPASSWSEFPFISLAPLNQSQLILRLISCNGAGTISLDDAEVLPCEPAHDLSSGISLGIWESIADGKYVYSPNYRDVGQGFYLGNYSRPMYDFSAFFSTFFTWLMAPNTYFTHRHNLGGLLMTNATVEVVSVYSGGSGALAVELSTNGVNWLTVTNYSPGPVGYVTHTNTATVPGSLLPATNLFVRVRSDAVGYFYVGRYRFQAGFAGLSGSAVGQTLLVAQRQKRSGVEVVGVSNQMRGLVLTFANTNTTSREYGVHWKVRGPAGERFWAQTNTVPAASTNLVAIDFAGMGWGENLLAVEVRDVSSQTTNFSGKAYFWERLLTDSSFGYLLPANTNCALWWCEGAYNVSRSRSLPFTNRAGISLSAARNEYEPFQLVLRPQSVLSNVTFSITAFTSQLTNNSFTISPTNVSFEFVEYVPVAAPTDFTSVAGDYPDPLLPWAVPVTLPAGSNQPVWVTVYVPKDTPPGDYQATLSVHSAATNMSVPVNLRVFHFSLSEVNHTKMNVNLYVDDYWHAATNSSRSGEIYDLYLQELRKHRMAPYKPHNYGKLSYSQGLDAQGVYYSFNFTNFDAALDRYLGEFGFNAFRLDGEIVPHSLNGQPRFTPAYRELYKRFMSPLMAHLREKGVLKLVLSYWIDEPNDTLIQTTVIPGMQSIGEAAPGLNRFLTREPIPSMFGLVETWCPYAPWLTMSHKAEREAFGEEFEWYVSGGPGYPYAMYFTDYPLSHPRMRLWQSEKFGFVGEDWWQATWWIGTLHAPVNPWTETMTRIFDGSIHGNGNGVLFYPPTKTPPASLLVAKPNLSMRLACIREGVEDREYFWLLQKSIEHRSPVLGQNHPAVVQAREAREWALGKIVSRTYYSSDAQQFYFGRQLVASAIEALNDHGPFMSRQPVSQAVHQGSNVTLRVEALGWPLPAYQWWRNGVMVSGVTNAHHRITAMDADSLGEWWCVASNSVGTATSAVARLAGKWVASPEIIDYGLGENRRVGDRTVLEVTAVSSLPLTYRWYRNGVLLGGATNNAWAITNLSVAEAGIYTVTASNQAGVATSGPIVLSVMPAYTNQPPVFSGQWVGAGAGYQLNLAVDNRPRAVLTSTNLVQWQTQLVVNPSGIPQLWTDAAATNRPAKFYRLQAN